MNVSQVEKIFTIINESAQVLQQELNCPYLEAVAETGENLFHQKILQEEISELAHKKLTKHYNELKIEQYDNETIRKSFQLAILKGMKEATQAHHQMTPDTIGLFMGYLVNRFCERQNEISVLDTAVGTGNLLTTILNNLSNKNVNSYASEIDQLLIKLAYINANLQRHPIQFFNQDSLSSLFMDPVDVVVCDLPVGYYPNDDGAKQFTLHAENGHSYSHHLFIEQSINYTKPGGYLFFLIPNHLFESEQSKKLHTYLKENVYIQCVLQLPQSMFNNEAQAKSILILQKKGEHVTGPKQVLLSELPSFSNKLAIEKTIEKINSWIINEKR